MVLAVSYILTYYLCFKGTFGERNLLSLPFSIYMYAFIYVIPGYLIIYYLFKLYTIKCTQKKLREAGNILLANVIGLLVFILILYLFRQFHFSRMMVAVFSCINVMLGIITRKFVFNKTVDFCFKV